MHARCMIFGMCRSGRHGSWLGCLPLLLCLTACGTSDSGSNASTEPDGAGADGAYAEPDSGGPKGPGDSAGADDRQPSPDTEAGHPDDATAIEDAARDVAAGDGAPDASECQSASDCGRGQICVAYTTCSMGCTSSVCVDDPCDGGRSQACLCSALCHAAVCSLIPDAGALECVNVPGGV
jgi:hypothetical protein